MSSRRSQAAAGSSLLAGTYSIEQAKAVAQVAAEVNATARLEVDMARATDGDFRGSGFIDVEPRIAPREPLRRIAP